MTEREHKLIGLLAECRTILIGQAFIMPHLKAAHQPMIDRIAAALAEPRAGSETATDKDAAA